MAEERFQVKHLAFSIGQLSVSLLFLKRKIKKKLGGINNEFERLLKC